MATFSHYEIVREIGRGGMAVVYLVRDPRRNQMLALKVLPSKFMHDPRFRARFEREGKALVKLQSPGIVPVYDVGDYEGQPYLVMAYMPGGSLESRIRKRAFTLPQASAIVSQLAVPLDAAHAQGIIHRDLKPANILFDEKDHPFITDFGIVKITEKEAIALTTEGGVLGTPAYMSPEQVLGKDQIDGRSDIYALGAIWYQMLAGKVPYNAETPMGQAMMHVIEPIPNLLTPRPDLPKDCQKVLEKAMAKDRENRYSKATELAEDIRKISEKHYKDGVAPPPKVVPQVELEKAATMAGQGTAKAKADGKSRMSWPLMAGIALLALIVFATAAGSIYLLTRPEGAATATATQRAVIEETTAPTRTRAAPATAALLLTASSQEENEEQPAGPLPGAGTPGLIPTLRPTLTPTASSGGTSGTGSTGGGQTVPTVTAPPTQPPPTQSGGGGGSGQPPQDTPTNTPIPVPTDTPIPSETPIPPTPTRSLSTKTPTPGSVSP